MEHDQKDFYLKVLEKFGIGKEEIEIYYCFATSLAGLAFREEYHDGKIVMKPILVLDFDFSFLSEQRKEGVVAHEIGHYLHCKKNCNPNRIKRMIKWVSELNDYDQKSEEEQFFINLYRKRRNKIKKLKKWGMLSEFYADDQAVERGYGNQILESLKMAKKNYLLTKCGEQELYKRIERLEEILGEEKNGKNRREKTVCRRKV